MNRCNIMLVAIVTAAAALLLAACGGIGAGDTVRLAVNPWTGSAVNAGVAKAVLEQELDYTVELVDIDENAQWAGLAAGDLETALSYVHEDIHCRGSCYLTGKPMFRSFLEGYLKSGYLTKISDVKNVGNLVTYAWDVYHNDLFVQSGAEAEFTQRLAPVGGQTMIGGAESYTARCAKCFQPPPAALRR